MLGFRIFGLPEIWVFRGLHVLLLGFDQGLMASYIHIMKITQLLLSGGSIQPRPETDSENFFFWTYIRKP